MSTPHHFKWEAFVNSNISSEAPSLEARPDTTVPGWKWWGVTDLQLKFCSLCFIILGRLRYEFSLQRKLGCRAAKCGLCDLSSHAVHFK